MRTRSQYTVNDTQSPIPSCTVTRNGISQPDRAAGGTLWRDVGEETIVDDPEGGRRMKAVWHQKVRTTRVTGMSSHSLTSGSDVYAYSGENCFWSVWGGGDGLFCHPGNISVLFPVTEDALIRSTMDAFYSLNDVDTLLNIVEAPQLVSSTQSLYQKIIGIPNHGALSKRRVVELLNRKPGISFLANGFLYYSFGVAPLISDMRKISHATSSFASRLRGFSQKAGQVVSVHRMQTGQFSNELIGEPPLYYGTSNDTEKFWKMGALYPTIIPTQTCTIRGIRSQKYSSSSFQKLDYLAGRFGSTGPASFLWEKIPFSFVVDWFLDLSGVMNYLDNALTGNTKNILDACISYKWGCIVRVDKLRYAPTLVSNMDGSQIALVEMSKYARTPIQPSVSVGLSGRFGKKQVALSAALISQMAANLKGKR